MNDFSSKNETFASNIYPDFTEKHKVTFYGIIYYESNEPIEIPKKTEKVAQSSPSKEIKGKDKDTKKITEGQITTLLKWSNTDLGSEFLESVGIKEEKDVIKLTSKEADQIIKKRIKLVEDSKKKKEEEIYY